MQSPHSRHHASRIVSLLLAGLVVGAVLLLPSRADARARVPILFSYGDEVYELMDPEDEEELIEEYIDPEELEGLKIGFMCQHFALFFADVWTWDCEIVAYDEDDSTYFDLPDELREELEDDYDMSDAKRGLWNKFGIFILAGGLVIVVVGGGASRMMRSKAGD